MSKARKMKHCLTAAFILLIGGCNTVRHVEYQENEPTADLAEKTGYSRTVEVQVDPAFSRLASDCVTVVPDAGGLAAPSSGLSHAMALRLRSRFARVIGPDEARALSQQLVVDLADKGDRAVYTRATRCPLFLDLKPWGDGDAYVVVWSRRTAGAEARLTDATGETLYWRARHNAVRADGGLPFSPVGALVNIFEAASLKNDSDVNASLADDLARRLVATLPELLPPSLRFRRTARGIGDAAGHPPGPPIQFATDRR